MEEKRHSRLFQEGYKALQEGRYTYAEIYYDQAIEKHEGHSFWLLFDELIDTKKKSKEDKKKEESKEKSDASASDAESAKLNRANKDTTNPASEECSEDGEGNNVDEDKCASIPDVIYFPLDNKLEEVLEYIQLRTDIANSYLVANCYDEAAPHMDFIFSHTEAVIKHVKIARENEDNYDDVELSNPLENNIECPEMNQQNLNAPGGRRQRTGMFVVSDLEKESILDCVEQHLRLHWVSSFVNSVYIMLERYKGTQGEKKRKKELDSAVVACMRVLEELANVSRRRSKSLTNAVVLSFLESLIEQMDSESSVTSAPDNQNGSRLGGPRVNTLFDKNQAAPNDNMSGCETNDGGDQEQAKLRLQRLHDRRTISRAVPAPQMGASLRYVSWMDDEIRRVVPGTNYHLEIQCGMIDDKRKKQLQKKSLKFLAKKKYDYNDRVNLGKCIDEENALLLFAVLLIQADVQLELGAATKGIQSLDLVDKLATQLYGVESMERQSLMRRVMESRRRGGALFMMFED